MQVLEVTDAERREFLSLVEMDQPYSVLGKERARSVLSAQAAEEASRRTSVQVLKHLSQWYVGAILELARCEDYEPDPSWIAATLRPRIAVVEAERALATLRQVGLLDEELQIPERPVDISSTMVVPLELDDYAQQFHTSVFELGAGAIGRYRANERFVRSACVALSDETVKKFMPRIQQLSMELIHARNEETSTPNRVYFMSVAFFPASLYSDTEYDPEQLDDEEE